MELLVACGCWRNTKNFNATGNSQMAPGSEDDAPKFACKDEDDDSGSDESGSEKSDQEQDGCTGGSGSASLGSVRTASAAPGESSPAAATAVKATPQAAASSSGGDAGKAPIAAAKPRDTSSASASDQGQGAKSATPRSTEARKKGARETTAGSGDQAQERESKREDCSKLAEGARILSQIVEKYPSTGKGMFGGKAKKRYLAVVPAGGDAAKARKADWTNGTISWFETEKEFKEKGKSKGDLTFANVEKVEHKATEDGGRAVAIKYKEGNSSNKMTILLPDPDAAKEYAARFNWFINSVQK